jgi:hypoxanthine phosphoribosyltransferase
MSSQARLHVLVTKAEIASTIKRLASAITRDYRQNNPLLIGILKGSFVFLADLVRQLDFPLEVEFVRLSSYGSGTHTSGKVELAQGPKLAVKGRHVLVVEDIIDTGITVGFLMDYLKKKNPASLKLCALTDKPARRRMPVEIDYKGITVPDKFLVGYGLDCNEKYRNLRDICVLEE